MAERDTVPGEENDMPRHTGSFKINQALERRIKALSGDPLPGGCVPFDPDAQRQVEVEMNGGEWTRASVMRIVWTIAHWPATLHQEDEAIHSCGNTGDRGTICCVNPDHIIKADARVRQAVGRHTAKTRARGRAQQKRSAA